MFPIVRLLQQTIVVLSTGIYRVTEPVQTPINQADELVAAIIILIIC